MPKQYKLHGFDWSWAEAQFCLSDSIGYKILHHKAALWNNNAAAKIRIVDEASIAAANIIAN